MKSSNARIVREVVFQVLLIIIVFIAVGYERHDPEITVAQLAFFGTYTLTALLIGYILLPRFFYTKRYLAFIAGLVVLLSILILVEELFLEQIFFPNSRGSSFPGVIHTLLEVLPVILILVGFKFAWDAQHKQTQLEQLNTIVAESRLQFLKSQINPHFLFNNLNNLYSYALENSSKTPKIILELSSLLRYMLYDCKTHVVPLEKELKYLQDFIRLQALQLEGRGHIEFEVEGKTEGAYIAPLILVVFIENSFKHSTASQVKNIEIEVNLELSNGLLRMHCANTFSQESNTDELARGIGLENVQTRLRLLYPDAHHLHISQKNNKYLVDLEIKLEAVQFGSDYAIATP